MSSDKPTTNLAGNPVLERIDREHERSLELLLDYLRIPSISTDPAYAEEARRCARFLCDTYSAAGLEARLIEGQGGGLPMVYAERKVSDTLPTVLFYGHYDVQPPDPLELWRSPPFEPTLEGEALVARGATDDKGQSLTHFLAVRSLLEERGELPVNVKFLIEGEEESGGETIERFVHSDAGRTLACDAVVVSDSSMFAPGLPSLLYGLKGMLYVELVVRGPERDLHSGSFGGAVRNPANALAEIIAGLRHPRSGRIMIPGFYDQVRPLADWERTEFAALPFDEEEYRRDLGVPELWGEEGYSTLERTWARPTLDVHGMWSGYQGPGAKTIIPASAGAKISMRLVPDQDPQQLARLLADHLQELAPSGVEVELEGLHSSPPFLVELEGPVVESALAALEDVWGTSPVRVREGGSIPIVSSFASVLEVPILLMGFGQSDDRLHSPNEKLDLPNFYQGTKTIVRLLERLGAGVEL